MGAVLALEHLHLDASRDQISIMLVGDQTNNIQALEREASTPHFWMRDFQSPSQTKGLPVLAELTMLTFLSPQGIVTSRSFLQKHPVIVESFLRGLLDRIDFSLALGNKPLSASRDEFSSGSARSRFASATKSSAGGV